MELELEDLTAAGPCPPDAPDLSAACKGVAEITAELEKELQSGDPFTAERGRQLVKALRLREAALGSAARPFTERGIALLHAGSLSQALDTLGEKKANPPVLVILDESEDRGTGQGMRQAAMAVLRICPFTYLTALTDAPWEEYHNAMEGLGMLKPLSKSPSEKDGKRLLSDLGTFIPLPGKK